MTRGLIGAIALLLALPLLQGAAWAAPDVLEITSTDTSAYPDVTLTVSAPADLRDGDFQLHEDDTPRTVRSTPVSGDRLEVVLVIDTSGSMQGAAMAAARDAAVQFLTQLPEGTRAAVIGFSDVPQVVHELDSEAAGAESAIATLEARGETSLYDAVAMAVRTFGSAEGVRRSIVLLSDGADTASTRSLEEAATMLSSSGASLEAIYLQTTEAEVEALHVLANAGGGDVLTAVDAAGLQALYEAVAADLRSQYELRYVSEAAGTTSVEVTLVASGTKSAEIQLAMPAPPESTVVGTPPPVAEISAPTPRPWLTRVLADPWAVRASAALVFIALVLLAFALLAPKPIRLSSVGQRTGATHVRGIADVGARAKRAVDGALRRRGRFESINRALERAGVPLRPAEFVLLVAAAAFVLAIAGYASSGTAGSLLLVIVAPACALVALQVLTSRRRAAFSAQLGDTLQMLTGSLRTGYGLLQAVDAVAAEADSPTAEEFRRVIVETRLGRDLDETLQAMADRLDSEDFQWVVQAMEIHREVGGDLAEVLDQVAHTLRARDQIIRQVKALSAEGRLSAIILLALPFVVVGGISIMNPSYMDELFTTAIGQKLIALGFVLMGIGAFWITRVVKPRY